MKFSMKSSISRRRFIERGAFGLLALLFTRSAVFAAPAKKSTAQPEKPKKDVPLPEGAREVPDSDVVARTIGYVKDTTQIIKKENPQYKAGQNCSNCALYAVKNEGWGQCQMIQAGLVRARGWCRSYSPKTA